MRSAPNRGFPVAEYHARLDRTQAAMIAADLVALFLTTAPELYYFTGFLTRFWESPTRPWYLVVPAAGAPVAVIPAIGERLMRQCWIDDIRTWQSPDYADDGVSLLADALREIVPDGGRIGVPSGHESHIRMPLGDWARLQGSVGNRRFADDAGVVRRLRLVKSEAEIDKIRAACGIADRAFARVPEIAGGGVPLDAVFRGFQGLCLGEGADWVQYLAGAAAQGGYGDVISPADAVPLGSGDVLMLDTGVVRDGYFCDFDRNYAVGAPSQEVEAAYSRLIEATQSGFGAARPGSLACDLHAAMDRVLAGGYGASVGRLGHGLGLQLTEWPSLMPGDDTVLVPGMVLTLEPVIEVAPGRLLVHEENIVIRESGAEFLSTPAGPRMPVIEVP